MKGAIVLILFLIIGFAICSYAQEEPEVFVPKKAEVDTDFDGVVDRIEYYDNSGQVDRVELDTTGDGLINEWVTYKNGLPVKSERDTNNDGKPDVWMEY